jgi:hypothetical protein
MTLNPKQLALSFGFVWGVACLLLGWVAAANWGDYQVEVMSSLYLGFKPGFVGGIIGGLWGLAYGLIGGYLIAVVYNYFGKKGKR